MFKETGSKSTLQPDVVGAALKSGCGSVPLVYLVDDTHLSGFTLIDGHRVRVFAPHRTL